MILSLSKEQLAGSKLQEIAYGHVLRHAFKQRLGSGPLRVHYVPRKEPQLSLCVRGCVTLDVPGLKAHLALQLGCTFVLSVHSGCVHCLCHASPPCSDPKLQSCSWPGPRVPSAICDSVADSVCGRREVQLSAFEHQRRSSQGSIFMTCQALQLST